MLCLEVWQRLAHHAQSHTGHHVPHASGLCTDCFVLLSAAGVWLETGPSAERASKASIMT